jgi:hypothetical protein
MRRSSRGMTLAVALILLLGVALLAVAAFDGVIADIALAGYAQQSMLSFEAAEAGIARTLSTAEASPLASPAWPSLSSAISTRTELTADAACVRGGPAVGFSLGSDDGFSLRHYSILAEGRGGRGAVSRLEQGFSVIAPTGSGTC